MDIQQENKSLTDIACIFGTDLLEDHAAAGFAAVVTMVTYLQFLDFLVKVSTLKKEGKIINLRVICIITFKTAVQAIRERVTDNQHLQHVFFMTSTKCFKEIFYKFNTE